MFSLEGKVAIVTGASRGIGRAIALAFADAGAQLALASRNESDLETLAKEIDAGGGKAITVPTDVTDREQIENLINTTKSELGRLDVLVNNAGGSRFMSPLTSVRPDGWTKMLSLNLDSVFHATQLGANAMIESGGGSIIQISSVAGLYGAPGLSFYSAAKHGVIGLTKAVAKELAQSNVRVNCIAPGWIATDLNNWMDEDTTKWAESTIPMGRMGEAAEISGAAVFLASNASSFVTGTTIVIDGGQLA
jgi:NAD(P)-dependent dehydrogenase (short-subunit alcohol dehydrogenase family)